MRKTIVTAFVALLAILAVSCDNISSGSSGLSGLSGRNDDGLVTVNLNIGGGGNSRSLTDTLAHSGTNRYEVIFRKQTTPGNYTYYQKDQAYAVTTQVKIPTGDYTANDAIILLGMNGDKTLLATGVISETSDGTTPDTLSPFSVTTTTTSVTFTVTSLEADISPVGTGFQIIGASTPGFTDHITTIASQKWFQVPTNTSNIRATLTISNFTGTGANIRRANGGTPVTFHEINPAPVITVFSVSSPAVGDAIGNGVFEITFTTPLNNAISTPDQYYITFNIPVVGFATTGVPNQVTWHIRGGTLTSNTPDHDGTTTPAAEAVPLAVVDDAATRDLIIDWS